MCGICGAVGKNAHNANITIMLHAMVHRGPDGEGIWRGANVVLGHRRLAIVDLSENGTQPFISADGHVATTVNGEIYNYPELRQTLKNAGAVFQSNCDSEIVLHAYKEWGVESFSKFNGMFAFALWDGTQQKLLLVRDRLGIKPVYYTVEDDTLYFASDIRALLLASGKKQWPIDAQGLSSYLEHQNRFGEDTLFAGIKLLQPGQYLEYHNNTFSTKRYWQWNFAAPPPMSRDDAVNHFREKINNAVSRHLMSDVPPAAYLSAGFDSSLVTSLAAQKTNGALEAFTGAFSEGGWYDETQGARLTASKLGIRHHEAKINAQAFRDAFDEMIFALEEPRMGSGALPQFLVARTVAHTHKMVLTGHGGDELFSGYPVFKIARLMQAFKQSPAKTFQLLRKIRISEIPHLVYFTLRIFFSNDDRPFTPVLFDARERRKGLTPAARTSLDANASPHPKNKHGASPYEILFTTYLTDYLPGLLIVEDKISMTHSLESRTPFLDNEIVEFSIGLSEDVKLSNGELKHIVKAAARGILPDAIFDMPKRGFPTPLSSWLRGELADWFRERVAGEQSSLKLLFKSDYLTRTVEHYLNSWKQHIRPLDEIPTQRMWMLLCLESWLRQHNERLGIQLVLPDDQSRETV